MDAFERIVAGLLEREGYWVRSSYKVVLSSKDKALLRRPTHPRFEIDLVGYKAASNQLRIVECKSFLDSDGVRISAFDGRGARFAERFKIFVDRKLRGLVIRRLREQLTAAGSCRPSPTVELCLAAGHIPSNIERTKLHAHFKAKGWKLLDEHWLRDALASASREGYTNDSAAVVAKLLLRRSPAQR